MTSNGRNLATNSKLLNVRPSETTSNVGRYNGNETLQTREDGFAEIVTNGTWRGIAMYADQTNPQVGEPFTFSCNVRNDSEVARNPSIFMMCLNAEGTRVYPPFTVAWIGSNVLDAGEERRLAFTATWTQEAVDLLAAGGSIRYSLQANKSDPLAFWAPKLERGTEMTPWRPAPEDSDVVSDMIITTDTKSLAVAVDVQQVDTWYYQTASTGTAPNKPDTASPSGWQTAEYAFDASKAVWSCQKTTLTDGTFYWGAVSKWSAYEGSVVAWNKADAAQESIDNLEVGGRNLLRRTANPSIGDMSNGYWAKWLTNDTVEKTSDGIKITSSGSSTSFRIPLAYEGAISIGETITVSFDYRGNITGTGAFYFMAKASPNVSAAMNSLVQSTTEWAHFEQTFSFSGSPGGPAMQFMFPCRGGSGKWLEIKDGSLKLERGSKPTDWTPAPEDVEAAIEEAAKVAGNYIIETASNDVWIHSEGHGPNSSGAATSDTYGWRIGSVFELVRAGLSYIKMWLEGTPAVAKLRLGLESAGHAIFSPSGMEVFTDSTTSVAQFGDDVRLGTSSGYNIKLDGDAGNITLNNGSTNILSLQRWNNNDASGELSIGKTSFHGLEFSGGTGVSCVANAGNSSVSDSVADNVTVNLTAQTNTKYSSFGISAVGMATLDCRRFDVMGDLFVEDISINASQIANTVLAAPNGSAGSPEFRQLVAADLPTVPISSGGTGQTSANAAARALGMAKTKGDSFTLNYVNAVGFLTNARKQAVVTVYFPYLIYGITSGNSCTLTGTFTARQNNGYCFGSTSTTPANLTSVTVSITRIQSGALTFSITGGEQTAAINNDPIALYFTSLTVTLT